MGKYCSKFRFLDPCGTITIADIAAFRIQAYCSSFMHMQQKWDRSGNICGVAIGGVDAVVAKSPFSGAQQHRILSVKVVGPGTVCFNLMGIMWMKQELVRLL